MKEAENRSEFVAREAVLISNHARVRMFERNITTDELLDIIAFGEIIEEYPDDDSCPSALILGFINQTAYHVVIAFCRDTLRVITVYKPDNEKWIEYRRRKL